MDMRTYWRSLSAAAKDEMARTLNCNRDYLAQIACGFRKGSPQMARQIESYTNGTVSKHELRPDVFEPADA